MAVLAFSRSGFLECACAQDHAEAKEARVKVYLCGPMSGKPDGNFPAFKAAARTLRARGLDVVSPIELNEADGISAALDPGHPRRAEFLARDVRIVADDSIDALVMLRGWEHSTGAQLEATVARGLGKPLLSYPFLGEIASDRIESVLQEAERLVGGARSQRYGHPAEHSARVAGAWRSVFGWDVDAYRVNLAMAIFKVARAAVGSHRDSLVDVAGYARTAEAVLAREGVHGFEDLSPPA